MSRNRALGDTYDQEVCNNNIQTSFQTDVFFLNAAGALTVTLDPFAVHGDEYLFIDLSGKGGNLVPSPGQSIIGGGSSILVPLGGWAQITFNEPLNGWVVERMGNRTPSQFVNLIIVATQNKTVPSGQSIAYLVQTSGAQLSITFPVGVDGQFVVVKDYQGGSQGNPILLKTTGGALIEDPNNPGSLVANADIATQGGSVQYLYSAGVGAWIQVN